MENFEIKSLNDKLGFNNNFEEIKKDIINNKLNNLEDPDKKLNEYNEILKDFKKFKGRETLDMEKYNIVKENDLELWNDILDFHKLLLNYVKSSKGKEENVLKDISSKKEIFDYKQTSYLYDYSTKNLIKEYGKNNPNQNKINNYKSEILGFHEAIKEVINRKINF
ncbi:hypothetical protein K9M48_00125 [Candidatus Gracilibacteria bacterium]|nr:hypothetical protein [Candidatus Gracilibacteria bacterium]